jgi:putative oxidoreductase
VRDAVFLIGRILFSLVFVGSGIGHLTQTAGSAQYATHKKVPNATLMVQLSGVLMLAGGLAVIFGVLGDLAALGLAVLCLIMAFMMHRFWEETDPQTKQGEMASFMKNISMAGAGLILSTLPYWPSSITDGVFKP